MNIIHTCVLEARDLRLGTVHVADIREVAWLRAERARWRRRVGVGGHDYAPR